eukprot:CFRG7011T1
MSTGDYENPYHYSKMGARQHTTSPIVTGTSVLGIKYNGGVMIAADTLGSYGSLARFRSVSRIHKVNDKTVVSGSGDYADFQFLKEDLDELQLENDEIGDGHKISPKAIHSYLGRVMYGRRSKMNPLWNQLVIAGYDKDEAVLGVVDKLGVSWTCTTVGTGYGAYIALPLLRAAYEKNDKMTREEAKKCLEESMRVLYYRDARSLNKIEICDISSEGVIITEPYALDTNWEISSMVKGFL